MFKKITSIILALLLILSVAGCAQTGTDSTNGSDAGSTTESTSGQGIETDEKLLSVEITLPASLFKDQDMSAFDADAYADEQGYKSAKVNEDGSVTVSMSKAKHKELIEEMAASLETSFAEFVNGDTTSYIKEITHNDDFTAVTMKVDRTAYESALDFTPLAIGLSVAMYQAFIETEYHVDISVVDAATGETIKTVTYPVAE